MTIDYYPSGTIDFFELAIRLRDEGSVTVIDHSENPEDNLTPNTHVLLELNGEYLSADKDGDTTIFTCCGSADVEQIIDVISALFDMELQNEDEIQEEILAEMERNGKSLYD